MEEHPWWRFGRHRWEYSTDDEVRAAARSSQDATARLFMGTFEAREVRTCVHCGRVEVRDIYGGNYIPSDWTLRTYRERTLTATA